MQIIIDLFQVIYNYNPDQNTLDVEVKFRPFLIQRVPERLQKLLDYVYCTSS